MGVDEVYEFLVSNKGKAFLTWQIAEGLDLSIQSVWTSMKTVSSYDDIQAKYLHEDLSIRKRGGWHYAYVPTK